MVNIYQTVRLYIPDDVSSFSNVSGLTLSLPSFATEVPARSVRVEGTVGPANQHGYIILRVGNLAD
jgi:hypothetical protein